MFLYVGDDGFRNEEDGTGEIGGEYDKSVDDDADDGDVDENEDILDEIDKEEDVCDVSKFADGMTWEEGLINGGWILVIAWSGEINEVLIFETYGGEKLSG